MYEDLDSLISKAKSERISLAVYKPKEITDFIIKNDSRRYDENKLLRIKARLREHDMFEDNSWRKRQVVRSIQPLKGRNLSAIATASMLELNSLSATGIRQKSALTAKSPSLNLSTICDLLDSCFDSFW